MVTSDTENVYITLTARGLNPDLYILARSGEEGSEIKLKRAGANKVVSPYLIGGNRMAQAILRPNVVDFIEIATGREHLELQMEEITIPADSSFVGENLVSSGFRKETGVIIIGIKKDNGKMVFNPESHTPSIEPSDTLIVLGEPAAIQKLEAADQLRQPAPTQSSKNIKKSLTNMTNTVFAHVPYPQIFRAAWITSSGPGGSTRRYFSPAMPSTPLIPEELASVAEALARKRP